MKAIFLEKHGPPEVLVYSDIETPKCDPDKIKIRVKNSSINHLDIWVREGIPGMDFSLPMILGSDASGIIEEIGSDVSGYTIGDSVIVQPGIYDPSCPVALKGTENFSPTYGILGETQNGVQSEYVCLDPINVYPMPKNLSFPEASSMPLTFMTAHQMLYDRACIEESDIILIYGGTSGVGSAALQIAKDCGCENIISTVGSKNKIEMALKQGADAVFVHDSHLYKEIRKYLGNKKVDIVFEHIGERTWDTSMKLLNRGGRIVTCGATTGNSVNINLTHVFFKQLSILGSTMGNIRTFKKVLDKINSGSYKPIVDKVFHASDIVAAHQRIEDRENIGKVVIDFS